MYEHAERNATTGPCGDERNPHSSVEHGGGAKLGRSVFARRELNLSCKGVLVMRITGLCSVLAHSTPIEHDGHRQDERLHGARRHADGSFFLFVE